MREGCSHRACWSLAEGAARAFRAMLAAQGLSSPVAQESGVPGCGSAAMSVMARAARTWLEGGGCSQESKRAREQERTPRESGLLRRS